MIANQGDKEEIGTILLLFIRHIRSRIIAHMDMRSHPVIDITTKPHLSRISSGIISL